CCQSLTTYRISSAPCARPLPLRRAPELALKVIVKPARIHPLRTVVLTTVVRPIRYSFAGTWPITLSARRQAAACGAGSGGSCGARGGLSGLAGTGIFSLRIGGLLILRGWTADEVRMV